MSAEPDGKHLWAPPAEAICSLLADERDPHSLHAHTSTHKRLAFQYYPSDPDATSLILYADDSPL